MAQYSVLLMHSTQGKCYALGELEQLLQEAGFVEMDYIPAVSHRSLITAKRSLDQPRY